MTDKCASILNNLKNIAKVKGFVSEDQIEKLCVENNLSLTELDSVYGRLQNDGVIIKDNDESVKHKEVNHISDKAKIDYDEIYRRILSLCPNLADYIEYLKSIEPPQRGEERELVYQVKQGNAYAYNRLVTMFLKVSVKFALHYFDEYNYDIEDSIQLGNIGLVIAVEKMPARSKYRYSTYAPWWIRQQIERSNCFVDSGIKVPVHVKTAMDKMKPHIDELGFDVCSLIINQSNYKDKIRKLSDEAGVSYDNTVLYLRTLQPSISLIDYCSKNDKSFSDCNRLIDSIDDKIQYSELKIAIDTMLNSFSDREKEVLDLRFGLSGEKEKTLEEVGSIFGVTRERIRQIEAKAIRKLQHNTRRKKLEGFL